MTPHYPQTAMPRQASAPRAYAAPYAPASSLTDIAANPHKGAFLVGVVILFFLFSHASEFIDTTGRLHLVMIIGVMGFIAVLAAGTVPRTIATAPGVWLTLFTVWLIMSIPFSTWKGESFRNVTGIWVKSYIAFFLIAGLIFTAEQLRRSLFWLGASTVAVIFYAFRAGFNSDDNRFSASYGSLGNSNDLASSLLMGVPFLLYVAMDKRRKGISRFAAGISSIVLLLVVFRTGSRGAIIAIAFMIGLAFVKTTPANKFKIIILSVLLAIAFPLVVSKSMLARFATIFSSNTAGVSSDVASAVDSTNARRELMKQGVRLTFRHPLFGVGIGNFTNQSANLFIARGETPMWFTCHDIFLLVSSETGIPGFLMFVALIVSCYKSQLRMQKQARAIPELDEIGNMSFCVMVSLTAYLVCGFFSTGAYGISLPLIAGLTVALEYVSKPLMDRAMADRQPQFAAAPFYMRPAAARLAPSPSAAFRS